MHFVQTLMLALTVSHVHCFRLASTVLSFKIYCKYANSYFYQLGKCIECYLGIGKEKGHTVLEF